MPSSHREAFKTAPPAGSRIISIEKVQHLLTVSAPITGASAGDRPGSIIRDYLLGEKERTMGGGLEMHRKKIPASITLMTLQDLVGRLLLGATLDQD